jgi:hypothetical protein
MTTTIRPFHSLPLVILLTLVACGQSEEAAVDLLSQDQSAGDATPLDSWQPDGGDALADTGADLPFDATDTMILADVAELGFDLRVPGTQSLTCTGAMEEMPEVWDVDDMDYVCTFEYGGQSGHLYFQATPISCVVIWGPVAEYEVQAWMAQDGTVTPLEAPGYDYGGNHHNDSLTFSWADKNFKIYHSSFGWGWRACHEPDCLQVLDDDGFTVLEDGCTTDRTLPVVCRLVAHDGTVETLEDDFQVCAGDPNLE